MTEDTDQDRGWRGSPDLWLTAAYEMLIDKGVDGVKIMPLATALNLSRTSFYWFFKDRKQLLSALLDRWEATTTAPLIAATDAYAATKSEAMLNVLATFIGPDGLDARLEYAVRNWAQQDADTMARVQAADAARLRALRALLERWGHTPDDADVRARTIYLVQIGYISMQSDEDISLRISRVPSYVEIYTDTRPTDGEMARFCAQIGAGAAVLKHA